MTTLHTYTAKPPLDLKTALVEFANTLPEKGAAVLLYSPGHCGFGRMAEDGSVLGADGAAINLDPVYEARAFHQDAELRWLNDPSGGPRGGQHRAVILADDVLPSVTWERTQQDVIEAFPTTYLLWGEGTGSAIGDGWSRLATARVGALDVPYPGVPEKGRVRLIAKEYLRVYPDHDDNVGVLDERLLRLEGV